MELFSGDGGTQRVPRLIGKSRAMYMQLTGETINSETAKDWGIVVEVVNDAKVQSIRLLNLQKLFLNGLLKLLK